MLDAAKSRAIEWASPDFNLVDFLHQTPEQLDGDTYVTRNIVCRTQYHKPEHHRAHPVFVIVYEVVDADLISQAHAVLRTRGRAYIWSALFQELCAESPRRRWASDAAKTCQGVYVSISRFTWMLKAI
jgi:hypothetical protein